jgi:hypothetical protein
MISLHQTSTMAALHLHLDRLCIIHSNTLQNGTSYNASYSLPLSSHPKTIDPLTAAQNRLPCVQLSRWQVINCQILQQDRRPLLDMGRFSLIIRLEGMNERMNKLDECRQDMQVSGTGYMSWITKMFNPWCNPVMEMGVVESAGASTTWRSFRALVKLAHAALRCGLLIKQSWVPVVGECGWPVRRPLCQLQHPAVTTQLPDSLHLELDKKVLFTVSEVNDGCTPAKHDQ